MCKTVLLLVFCYHVLSQPITDEISTRLSRQLNECCPCTDFSNGGQDKLADNGQLTRAGGLDDSSSRARSTDTEGASSIFFPSTVHVDRPVLKPNNMKEESKNLLQPEVTLAASMLDTLREATEEEYHEAVSREAARNAAESNDAIPEESARNVVIIVNPREQDDDNDFIAEASHAQKSRCIHPSISRPTLGKMQTVKPFNAMREALRYPQLKHSGLTHRNILHSDSNLGASNVDERIIDINGNTPKLQLRNFNNPLHSDNLYNIVNNQNCEDELSTKKSNLGHLLSSKPLISENMKFPLIPKLKFDEPLRKITNNKISSDEVDFQSRNNAQEGSGIDSDETINFHRYTKVPLNLRQLLKLRDVELVPKYIRDKSLSKSRNDELFKIPAVLETSPNPKDITDICDEINSPSNFVSMLESSNIKNKQALQERSNEDLNSDLHVNRNNDAGRKLQVSYLTDEDKDSQSPSLVKTSEAIRSPEITVDNGSSLELRDSAKVGEENQLELSKTGNGILNGDDVTENLNKNTYLETSNLSLKTIDSLQGPKIYEDSDSGSSNNIPITTMLSDVQETENLHDFATTTNPKVTENIADVTFIKNNEDFSDITDEVIADRLHTPLSENLSNFKENVATELGQLGGKPLNSELFKIPPNNQEVTSNNSDEQIKLNLDNNAEVDDQQILHSVYSPQADSDAITSDILIHDLQNMSDKLLISSLDGQNEEEILSKAVECKNKPDDTKFIKNFGTNIENESVEAAVIPTTTGSNIDDGERINNVKEIVSLDDSEHANGRSSLYMKPDMLYKEMDTGASDNIPATLPGLIDPIKSNLKLRLPLLENIIDQTVNDPLNLQKSPLGKALNLNIKPYDFKQRLTSIFKMDDKSGNDDSSSFESDCTHYSSKEAMSPEASTIDSTRKLPPIKPLDDFNDNFFRNKQMKSIPIDTLSKSSRLNLNSYRAKVPIPGNLEIKYGTAESRLGKKARISSSDFGLNKKKAALTSTPMHVLTDHLENFPTLDKLRNTIRSNTKNLLSGPTHPDLNLFTESLRSNVVEDITGDIRKNTQKTMKELQRRMKSNLRKVTTSSPVGEPYAKPQELLDDINDKLKGIHYDINDRLSSFRDNVLDSSRLNTLINQPREAVNRNFMTNLRQNNEKRLPARIQSSASTVSTQKINPQGRAQQEVRYLSEKSHDTQDKEFDFPIYKPQSNTVNSFLPHLHRSPLLRENQSGPPFLKDIPPLSRKLKESKNIKIPILRKAIKPSESPSKLNKVTISFGTTTIRPVPILRSSNPTMTSTQPGYNNNPSIFTRRNDESVKGQAITPIYKSNAVFDTQDSPRELKHIKIASPRDITSSASEDIENIEDALSSENQALDNFRSSIFKDNTNSHSNKFKSLDPFGNSEKSLNIPEEPLKENVSYKCRMVCTKEFT